MLSSGPAARSAPTPQLVSLFRSSDRMQEVFGPKKKPRDSPAPGLPSLTSPPTPVETQRYIGLCPNKSEAPALPATALTANSVSSGSVSWPEPLPPPLRLCREGRPGTRFFGLRVMARRCGKMIEAPEVCARDTRQSSLGTGGRVERAYLPPTHQTLVLAPNGWVGDRDGRPGARCSRPAISGT